MTNELPLYYDCGICGHFHPIAWDGDCRDDANRFTHTDLDAKHGEDGWTFVDPCLKCGTVGPDIDGDCGCDDHRDWSAEPMTPFEAWLYAAEWGSYMRDGDPGACMYGFDERCLPQSEEHRAACLRWIDEQCKPQVESDPDVYDRDELDKLDALRRYLESAPLDTPGGTDNG